MVSCSVVSCANCSGYGDNTSKGITFHSFPNDPKVKDGWITATGKKNWFPSKYSKICSAHFQENDFNPTRKHRVLLDHTYPTIKIWTADGNFTQKELRITPPTSPSASSPSKSIKRLVELDLDMTETAKIQKLRRIINKKEDYIRRQRTKIKSLQTKTRRYKNKIMELQEMIKKKLPQNTVNIHSFETFH